MKKYINAAVKSVGIGIIMTLGYLGSAVLVGNWLKIVKSILLN